MKNTPVSINSDSKKLKETVYSEFQEVKEACMAGAK